MRTGVYPCVRTSPERTRRGAARSAQQRPGGVREGRAEPSPAEPNRTEQSPAQPGPALMNCPPASRGGAVPGGRGRRGAGPGRAGSVRAPSPAPRLHCASETWRRRGTEQPQRSAAAQVRGAAGAAPCAAARPGPARRGAAGGRPGVGRVGPAAAARQAWPGPAADPACQRGPAAASPAGPGRGGRGPEAACHRRHLLVPVRARPASPRGASPAAPRLPPAAGQRPGGGWGGGCAGLPRLPGGRLPLPGRAVAPGKAPSRGFVVLPGVPGQGSIGTALPARGDGAQQLLQQHRATVYRVHPKASERFLRTA